MCCLELKLNDEDEDTLLGSRGCTIGCSILEHTVEEAIKLLVLVHAEAEASLLNEYKLPQDTNGVLVIRES
jgi:hypothetical protein